MKKINCKHGLTKGQEIQARRLRVDLEKQTPEAVERVKKLKRKWVSSGKISFIDFLLNEDIVCYSAVQRIEPTKRRQILSIMI